MRNSLKLLAICFAFYFTALILIACGPSIDAASPDKLTQEQASDSSNDAENQADETGILTPEPIITDEPITEEQPDEPVTTNDSDETPPHHEHSYGAWKTTKDATCTESGEEIHVCDCGFQQTRIIEPHHQYEFVGTIDPTCTKSGYDLYRCSICYNEKHENLTEPNGHNFNFQTFTNCENGTITHKCHCGETRTETIDALGHDVDPETGYCNHCHELIEAPKTEEPTNQDENTTSTTEEPTPQNEDTTSTTEEDTTLGIKDLKGSYWYLKSKTENDWTLQKKGWAICFEAYKATEYAEEYTGEYQSYTGSLENGKFIPSENSTNSYHGTYSIVTKPNNQSEIRLTDDSYPGQTFILNYEIKLDITTNKTYETLNGDLFKNTWKNSTLIFAGYGVQ